MKRHRQVEATPGIAFSFHNAELERLNKVLPFSLTPAQERVIHEIFQDMSRSTCMNRLLQGDVGCGKTVVALHAMVRACGSGYQVALMAPTEVLSEQHYWSLKPLFEALNISCVLLKGGQAGRERVEILADIHSGKSQVVPATGYPARKSTVAARRLSDDGDAHSPNLGDDVVRRFGCLCH
jgi:ATP-dependent DNA helicase RecG